MKNQLLHTPEGVRDIYNDECEEKLFIQNCLHSIIRKYGYRDIQTPSFEFFDIFNKERGSVASKNMFKFFDREGNTLVLRPDMTPSIARCAAKYFENNTDPIRLCYTGSTFVNNSRYQGRLKETTQAGCELIGDASIGADAEMIALLIESILRTGLTEFQVEIGHIGFFKGLVKEAGLSQESETELRDIIRGKNIFRVGEILDNENISKERGECFYKLPQLFGEVEILNKAKELTNDDMALDAITHLEKLYDLLKVYGFEKYVSFDLGMLSNLDYYTGVIFQAYTYDVGEPVANGGRYDKLIRQFGKDMASVGFCITIDLLHQALKRQDIPVPIETRGIALVYDEENHTGAIKLAKFLREEGVKTTLFVKNVTNSEEYDEVINVDSSVLERYGI